MSTQSLSGETRIASSSRRLIAPRWHTTVVVLAFLGLAIAGVMFKESAGLTKPAPSHWALYIALIIAEVGLYYFVRLGLRKGGTSIPDMLGKMDPSIPAWIRDAAIAAVVWGFWIGI